MSADVGTNDGLDLTLRAACRASTVRGLPANPATLAAMLLRACGSAVEAIQAVRRMPPGDVWPEVEKYLARFDEEETADTERPMAAGGSGR